MPDPAAVLARCLVARGTDLARFGCTRAVLSGALRRGEIIRVRSGVFASPRASADVVAAAEHGGALTCAKALRAQGVWTLDDDMQPHVSLGAGGRSHPHAPCDCVAHYRPGPMRLGMADVEQALIHAFACYGDELFFAAYESAWNKGLIGSAARARIRATLPRSAEWLLDFARADAQSGLESILRLRLHLMGIALTCQVKIPDVGRVDFVIEGRIILEADGEQNHGSTEQRHRDRWRDAAASRQGYETLRFDYALIIHHWAMVAAAILAALARAHA